MPGRSAGGKKILVTLAIVLATYVGVALLLDAYAAIAQPVLEPGSAEGVLRTFDPDGTAHDKRLIVIDDGGTLWIQSGHWFRGWYYRLVRNPQVELIWKGEVRPYRAVPIDTSESEGRLRELIKKRVGSVRFYAIRTLLLFADIKPVRLDPVDAEPGARVD